MEEDMDLDAFIKRFYADLAPAIKWALIALAVLFAVSALWVNIARAALPACGDLCPRSYQTVSDNIGEQRLVQALYLNATRDHVRNTVEGFRDFGDTFLSKRYGITRLCGYLYDDQHYLTAFIVDSPSAHVYVDDESEEFTVMWYTKCRGY
jgi:hypothetical protein